MQCADKMYSFCSEADVRLCAGLHLMSVNELADHVRA